MPRLDPFRARGRRGRRRDRTAQLRLADRATTIEAGVNFAGLDGSARPLDPTGAAGETQYVQSINFSLAVFDKRDGRIIKGPVEVSSLWTGINSPCARHDTGDPIVQYDRLAKRWLVSQFLLENEGWHECVAVSASEDATGTYHLYRFSYDGFPDYPKIGAWPDAYYVSYNMLSGPQVGGWACAWERQKMLDGAPSSQVQEVCYRTVQRNLLPSDFDGRALPPPGTPNFFLKRGPDGASLKMWKFHVDWANTQNSRFGVGAAHDPDISIPVEPFNDSCGGGNCIPQQGTTRVLASLGERLMFRVAYRNFPSGVPGDPTPREALVTNHSVEPTNAARAGIRWYEIRSPNGTPTVFQQGTFVPDTRSRWMGSIGMDGAGNIAAGYSISGTDMPPGIRVAGRLVTDPPGVFSSENSIADGRSQAATFRWGDYSHMSIDPTDDCTFWFTAQYFKGGDSSPRATRISSFRLGTCGR
jgi:hypothetical protein